MDPVVKILALHQAIDQEVSRMELEFDKAVQEALSIICTNLTLSVASREVFKAEVYKMAIDRVVAVWQLLGIEVASLGELTIEDPDVGLC